MQTLLFYLSGAFLLTLTAMAGCSGDQARYDDQARATDPAMTDTSQPDATTTPPVPPPPSAPETEPAMADAPLTPEQALAAYNAALLDDNPKVELSDTAWKQLLSDEEFYILRRSGTEYGGTGRYLDNEDAGSYHCAGCGLYLYDAAHKFHSGCGWPSFNQEIGEGVLTYHQDISLGRTRTEMRCARCDGHMGHVFNDAPGQPTGLRHCVNGGAIIFVPEGEEPQATIAKHREANAHR